jgi:hypothetical protein
VQKEFCNNICHNRTHAVQQTALLCSIRFGTGQLADELGEIVDALENEKGSTLCLPVTISATANPPSSTVATHATDTVIGHTLCGGGMAALPHARAGTSAMVSLLDPLHPLLHRHAKSSDTWYQ